MVLATKRKRSRDSHGGDGVAVAAAEEGGAGLGRAGASSNGSAPGQTSGQSSPTARGALNGGEPGGVGEQTDAMQQQELEGGRLPPETDAQSVCRRERCECPCFCGRRDLDTYSPNAARTGVDDAGSCAIARVGTASADLSRVEQLVGGAAMVRGCALGVGFVARATEMSTGLSVSGALDLLDGATAARDNGAGEGGAGKSAGGGLVSLLFGGNEDPVEGREGRDKAAAMGSFCGGPLVALPRRFEVAAALHRLPGVRFRPADEAAVAVAKTTTSSAEAVEEEA